jgi:(2R)-sulfolactate sulfo-lyase subunit alpha
MAGSDPQGAPQFLVHRDGDHVGVAVVDLEPGPAKGAVLASNSDISAEVRDAVPLGHKFALVARAAGDDVIEYGVRIGVATRDIAEGDYVHVHNLRSARWPQSQSN